MTKKSRRKKDKNAILPEPKFTGFAIVSERIDPPTFRIAKGFVKPNVNLKQGHLKKKKGK